MAELIALLNRLSEADLNRVRQDIIPGLLRSRVADAREAEYAAYVKGYDAQKAAPKGEGGA